jgi:hypothetical protein
MPEWTASRLSDLSEEPRHSVCAAIIMVMPTVRRGDRKSRENRIDAFLLKPLVIRLCTIPLCRFFGKIAPSANVTPVAAISEKRTGAPARSNILLVETTKSITSYQ